MSNITKKLAVIASIWFIVGNILFFIAAWHYVNTVDSVAELLVIGSIYTFLCYLINLHSTMYSVSDCRRNCNRKARTYKKKYKR